MNQLLKMYLMFFLYSGVLQTFLSSVTLLLGISVLPVYFAGMGLGFIGAAMLIFIYMKIKNSETVSHGGDEIFS